MPNLNIIEQLTRPALFRDMPAEFLQRLASHAKVLEIPAGTLLFQQGEPAVGLYCVVEGSVKLSVSTAEGHEKIVEIIRAGMSFGEAVVFLGVAYPVCAETMEPCTLIYVDGKALLQAVRENSEFALTMLASLSRRLHFLVKEIESLSLHSAIQRTVGFLLSEAANQPLTDLILLPASKKTIASRLNLTPETLSRVFRRLSAAGVITLEGRTVHVHDFSQLKQFQQNSESGRDEEK